MTYADYRISEGSAGRRLIGLCVGMLVTLTTIYALNEGLKLKLVEKVIEATVVQVQSAPEPLPTPQPVPEVVPLEPVDVTIAPPKFKIEAPPQAKPTVTAKVQPPKPVQQPAPVQAKPVQPDKLASFHASNSIPPYPASAKRNCEQGLVTLNLLIGADGRVSKAGIATSSGYPALDNAALNAAQDWRYSPARTAGRAVESTVMQPVRFDLRNEIGRSMTAAEVRACLRN